MEPLVSQQNHKYLSTLIVSIGAFLGFEAISYAFGIYQLKATLYLTFYIYAFHIFWLTFLFDLHLKKRAILATARINYKGGAMVWEACKQRVDHLRNWEYLRHYQNYLVLPGLIYWSTVVLMYLNLFNHSLKQLLVVTSTLAMSVAYWFMKEHVSRKLEHDVSWIRILSLVKLYAAFLVYSALMGTTRYFNFDFNFLILSVLTLTFLLIYQALFQHKLLTFVAFLSTVMIAIVMAFVSFWVYVNWNSEYFTAGLVMLAVYNMLWGVLHHRLENTLTRKIFWEYFAMMLLIVSFLLASHNFNQRIE